MATLDVPGVGAVDQRWAIGGAALVLGIVGYTWWRRGTQQATSTTVNTPEDATDAFYEASQDAYQGAFGTPALTPHGTTADPNSLPPASNAEWAQRAITMLTAVNIDATMAAMAIGKYMTRQTMSDAEADIVRTAIGMLGQPPQGDFPIKVGPGSNPVPTPEIQQLWDEWQVQNLATGSLTPNSQWDWGMLARRTLPSGASRLDVYVRSLDLQKKYPDLHKKYPMYVPANVASQVSWP